MTKNPNKTITVHAGEKLCAKHGTPTVTRTNGAGYQYEQCTTCALEAQQLLVHRKLSDAELLEKEERTRDKYHRTMAVIRKLKKERGLGTWTAEGGL